MCHRNSLKNMEKNHALFWCILYQKEGPQIWETKDFIEIENYKLENPKDLIYWPVWGK